ncbi:MAG: hydantoinase/oxoprolinase family protein, partial [Firmicutes bacterium]|nr:hydantoinase/oxoprolinase family protein [Bacillota bacterium]
MAYIIGIDTGGTYTDAVLLDTDHGMIKAKAKAFTTKEDLSVGIEKSLRGLGVLPDAIEKIVLSTTLATNAVVENELAPVGAIYIGKRPRCDFPDIPSVTVKGKINVKGREEVCLDENEILAVADHIKKNSSSIAVVGYMSVRNPVQELRVKELIREHTSLPVVCGHELSGNLGFKERAATAILNAALLPIIASFLDSMEQVLKKMSIDAPVFMVRGDGTMAELGMIREKPAETVLSGPATSIIGAKYLTGSSFALISDMGGTTTDTAVLENGMVRLSEFGA